MIDIVGKRYWFFALSLLVIVPGMVALGVWGLPLAIDYTGGSLLEVSFEGADRPEPAEVVQFYSEQGIPSAVVQTVGENGMVIRSRELTLDEKSELLAGLEALVGSAVTEQRFDLVGATIGGEVAERSAVAVGLAAAGILLYITYAFRGVPHAIRFGTAAIIAMLHDVAVVFGAEAILGHYLGWEADSLFLTALLTVIGFSVHDTIVVFDRVRENQAVHRRLDFETVVNHSIVQTLDRSINTQLTVMLTLLALLLFGGVTTQHFVSILLVGVFSGTYSSIFNAAPILVVWEKREWRKWFRRGARASA
jgi:preprotein translocase subunit SecF